MMMKSHRILALALGILLLPGGAMADSSIELQLKAADVARLKALAPDAEAQVRLRGGEKKSDETWTLQRVDVYAEDAQIWVTTEKGMEPFPRSPLQHYIGIRGHERLAFSIMPDGSEGNGLLINEKGSFALDISAAKGGLQLKGHSTTSLPDGTLLEPDCMGAPEAGSHTHEKHSLSLNLPMPAENAGAKVATRRVRLALDTDNEVMQQKFNNNSTTANNYLAALVLQMSVVYEKEPSQGGGKVKLEIGHTTLRPSTTPDPYNSATGGDIQVQLNEFGAHWASSHNNVQRAFALLISGKSAHANSAAGIGWVLNSGSYCASTNLSGGPGIVAGHYSVNRVFKFAGSQASHDALLVAHELGHNFGLSHTHCTSNGAGGFLDQCFSGESSSCYNGPTSCPAANATPGVPAGQGSLMSYCHLRAGCNSNNAARFHPIHTTTLNNRLAAQPATCLLPLGDEIFSHGFEG